MATILENTDSPPSAAAPQTATPRVAPVTGWRKLAHDSILVGGSTAVCHAIGLVTSLLFRALLTPAQMGIWQALRVFLSYGNYTNLGISKGATRELNVALGRGDTATAERGLDLAFTVNTLGSVGYGVVLLGAAAWCSLASESAWSGLWGWGLAALAVIVVLQRHVTFHVSILRARQAFHTGAKFSIVEAVLTLLVGGLATWAWGLPGMYVGTIGVLLGSLGYLHFTGVRSLGWAWDRREMVRLTAIGMPILLTGVATTLFRSLDKLMVLGYLSNGEYQLGCYSMALLVGSQLYGAANMLSIVFGARYAELYGASQCRATVARLAARTSELQAAMMAIAGGISIVLAPAVLGRLFPDYQPGLAPLTWVVPGVIALAMAFPGSQHLLSVSRERLALLAIVLAIGVAALGNHVALVSGWGINGVAIVTSLAYGVYFVMVTAMSLWRDLDRASRWRYVVGHALVLGPTIALAIVLETLYAAADTGLRAATLKTLAVTLAWSGTMLLAWRYGDWSALWHGSQKNMQRPDWTQLAERCQKPDYRRIGNWYARRVSRPLALRVTWLVLPTGISAHKMTLVAWACGVAACVALAQGTMTGWLVGAGLLQLWYLLDHVDGQLARYHGTESLDGVALDYLMHHTLNLLVPLGAGYGLFAQSGEPAWLWASTAWGLALLVLSLATDARNKAFIQRLKRLHGELHVTGGSGGRPEPSPPAPSSPLHRLAWLARKACEMHVVMNILTLLALASWVLAWNSLAIGSYVAVMAVVSLLVAGSSLARSLNRGQAEQEFAQWYRVPEGHALSYEQGWWHVTALAASDEEYPQISQMDAD